MSLSRSIAMLQSCFGLIHMAHDTRVAGEIENNQNPLARREPLYASCPQAQSPQGLGRHPQTFRGSRYPSEATCFCQLAFKGLETPGEEDKKRFYSNPRHQQESASRYGQHQERAEMMIVPLTAQRASFFHIDYPTSSETVKSSKRAPVPKKHRRRRRLPHAGLLFPQERSRSG